MKNTAHILMIEHENRTARALKNILAPEQYRITVAASGEMGLAITAAHPPDLILLDMDITDMDGAEVCASLRAWTQLPIIALSEESTESYKVRILDLGADDFIVKPFGDEEMLARIRVALRHVARNHENKHAVVKTGSVEIDLEKRKITKKGAEIRLTATEFKLLGYMVVNAGRLLTSQMILTQVWGPEDAHRVEYLRTYIRQLRKKLEDEPGFPKIILNEPHVGYRFVLDRAPVQ